MAIRSERGKNRNHEDHWEILDDLGEGGQGKAHLVVNKATYGDIGTVARQLSADLLEIRSTHDERIKLLAEAIEKRVRTFVDRHRPENQAVLKVLHAPENARDPENAAARIEKEIAAMESIQHPNLLRIIDKDVGQQWFVSEYHPGGTLDSCIASYDGDVRATLRAIRPVVEGVAKLHKEQIVHRDIKPHNIFVASDGRLVLGDFGLAYFVDEQRTRPTNTLENVGSWDWMPPWAKDRRLEEIRPSFDVFSLGKLIWAMVSSQPVLSHWYFNEGPYNVETEFLMAPDIDLANPLFAKCIVERERNCLSDASELLREIDDTLALVARRQRTEQLQSNHQQVFRSGSPVSSKLDVERERFSTILADLLNIHVVILSMLTDPPSSDEPNEWLRSQEPSIVKDAYADLVRFGLANDASNMGGHLTKPEDYGHLAGMLTEQGRRFVEAMFLN